MRSPLLLLLVVVGGCWTFASAGLLLNLDGTQWTAHNANGSVSVPATVPGGIYTDLRAAGVLTSDFFYGFNDELQRWVSYDNWTYERTFQVDASWVARRHAQIVLHGADTVAEVLLNGERLGAVDNMFVRHVLSTRGALREGANRLSVAFTSAPVDARRRFLQHERRFGYAVPPECVPPEYHGECLVNHLRKMQASFSWDWGPAFPSQGLWKSVALEAFDLALLRDVSVRFAAPSGSGAGASVHVRAFLEAGVGAEGPLHGTLHAQLRLPSGNVNARATVTLTPDAQGECVADISIKDFEEPPLWWPNGEGEQPLLPLTVAFVGGDGVERSSLTRRVAYRFVELVQDPVANLSLRNANGHKLSENDIDFGWDKGLTFYFRVNGRPIFAKGSNWIPANVLPELGAAPDTVRHLLRSAHAANMNMLRVWGGGVYESDIFYDLADELGLLIWQDMMFACSMYPADEHFLTSVRAEVQHQVLRLQTHASVALWAGNNENEGALVDNWYGTYSNYTQYKSDYITLYANTIRPLVLELDPTREFVVSSPSNGLKTDEEGYVSNNPSSSLYGDVHYYNYLSDGWNADTYRWTRFASEYGFQSLPSLWTLRPAARAAEDLAAGSAFMEARQHHPGGNAEMAALAKKRLPLPEDWRSGESFPAFVFMTQIYQAVAIQTQTEHYRRLRSQLTERGEGLCMGALYWQLNDVWQAPTWSSIDFEGRWKPLHHLAEEFFAPQMASAYVTAGGVLHVWALNDHVTPVLAVQLQGRAGRWADKWTKKAAGTPRSQWTNLTESFTLDAACSQHVLTETVADVLRALPGCAPSPAYAAAAASPAAECFLELRLVALGTEQWQLGPPRTVLPVPLTKAIGLQAPLLQVESVSEPAADGSLKVEVRSDRPAAFVWLEAGALRGRFSRNAFLMAEASATLRFLPAADALPPSAEQLRNAITISSVANMAASAA